jgi:hypothetical protein
LEHCSRADNEEVNGGLCWLNRRDGDELMAEGEGFDVLEVLILKDLANFRCSQTARSGQKAGSRNEIGTVNARSKEAGVQRAGALAF